MACQRQLQCSLQCISTCVQQYLPARCHVTSKASQHGFCNICMQTERHHGRSCMISSEANQKTPPHPDRNQRLFARERTKTHNTHIEVSHCRPPKRSSQDLQVLKSCRVFGRCGENNNHPTGSSYYKQIPFHVSEQHGTSSRKQCSKCRFACILLR